MSEENNRSKIQAHKRGRPGHGPGHGPGQGMIPGEKANDFKGTMSKLMAYLAVYKIQIFVVIIFAILSTSFSIYGPKLLGKATTTIFEGVMGQIGGQGVSIDFDYIGQILLFLLAIYLISSVFSYIQGYIMSGISQKVSYKMRKDISEKMNLLPFSYYDKTSYGDVLSRVSNDVDTISRTLNQSLLQIITSATTVIGILIMMLSISGKMTLIALAIIPISMLAITMIVKRSQKYFKSQQASLGDVNGHVEEMFSGHVVVKAFNAEEKNIDAFNVYNDELYDSAWKSQFFSGLMQPIMNVVGNIGYVAVCVMGGALAANGTITVGNIQAFIQYVRNFTQPITQLANISNILQQTAAAAERVFEFLEEPNEILENENPIHVEDVKGHVVFNNVQFAYKENETIIKNFSVEVKPGQRVAIVGPTGAGKTTLVKLLMRFYDVSSGEIRIDDVNIQDFSRKDLRSQFGMVLQDTWLYNDTIMENIRYGRLDATDEEVIEASKAAHVDAFVKALPNGYQMVLNEEATNISQGQKQLITIARAILANPSLLILDEATSSVDTRTEVQIQTAMNRLMSNKTSFIIAHRLSTIRDADVILVMDKGDIVEQGSHEVLIAKNGFYANLYNSQFEVGMVS